MQERNLHRPIQFVIAFFIWVCVAAASPVEIVGTLRNVKGKALSGQIKVFQEVPHLTATTHLTDETGSFRIAGNSRRGLVLHASAFHHASAENVIAPGVSGTVHLDIVLPLGQHIQGRVVDTLGNGVPGAAVRVRYHEPGKPVRRVSFDRDERTDGDGRFLIQDVGIQTPFVVDVLASDYPPVSSKLIKLAKGETELDDIVLVERGASVVVQVLGKSDQAVSGAGLLLLADPTGLGTEARGSWLHHRAYRQRGTTSSLGNFRFRGVPPGRIIVISKVSGRTTEQRAVVSAGQELRMTLRSL